MSSTYIGTAELESGLMSTAHLWDRRPFDTPEDVVEEGYFYKNAKPHEGIRTCWTPKDDMDSEFYQEEVKPLNTSGATAADCAFDGGWLLDPMAFAGYVNVDGATDNATLEAANWINVVVESDAGTTQAGTSSGSSGFETVAFDDYAGITSSALSAEGNVGKHVAPGDRDWETTTT